MNQEKIGKFIAQKRKENKLTQQELSLKIGVTDKTISNWENGKYMPDYSVLPNLCDVLNISINELLCGEHLNQEDYQKKLEENIILNMALLKKKVKLTMKKGFIIIILAISLFLLFIIGFLVFNEVSQWKNYLSNDEVNIRVCKMDNRIYFSAMAKDSKPIYGDVSFNNKIGYFKVYRVLNKKYMTDVSSSTGLYSFDDNVNEIYFNDKIIYDENTIVNECEKINY